MKSIVLSSVVTALIVFSGCSKDVAVDADANKAPVEIVEIVEIETVPVEEVIVVSNTLSMSDVQSELPAIYFAFDKYNLDSDMKAKVATAAVIGKTGAADYNVKLEGNCDEWGSDEYNFALGLKRANAVKQGLVSEGIDSSRISMVSYGESDPVCTEKTQACWSKNRRVNFKLLP